MNVTRRGFISALLLAPLVSPSPAEPITEATFLVDDLSLFFDTRMLKTIRFASSYGMGGERLAKLIWEKHGYNLYILKQEPTDASRAHRRRGDLGPR